MGSLPRNVKRRKEAAISQYNRQKAKSRRKVAAEPVESNKVDTEIEPLVDVPEPRSRRGKKSVHDKSSLLTVLLKNLPQHKRM